MNLWVLSLFSLSVLLIAIGFFAIPTLKKELASFATDLLKEKGIQVSYQSLHSDGLKLEFSGVNLEKPFIGVIKNVLVDLEFDLIEWQFKPHIVLTDGILTVPFDQLSQKLSSSSTPRKNSSEKRIWPAITFHDITLRMSASELGDGISFLIKDSTLDPNHSLIDLQGEALRYGEDVVFDQWSLQLKKDLGAEKSLIFEGQKGSSFHVHTQSSMDLGKKNFKGLIRTQGMTDLVELPYLKNRDRLKGASRFRLSWANEEGPTLHLFGGIANLALEHQKVSKKTIGPLSLRFKNLIQWDRSKKTLLVKRGQFRFADPSRLSNPFQFTGQGHYDYQNHKASAKFSSQNHSCQDALKAFPKGLFPIREEFDLKGTFSFTLDLDIAFKKLHDFAYLLDHSIDCEVKKTSERFLRQNILSLSSGNAPQKDLYQKWQVNYTPLNEIAPIFIKTLVSFEDGGFYRHGGIDEASLVGAIRRNLAEGRIKVGGSTITMQMVKNLFLTHERTINRKLQEVFLTWYLENLLTKDQILELYVNIIEFGPQIFGIKEASEVLFAKSPIALNLRESAYLASVLPSPVRRFKSFCRGGLSDSYQQYLESRLRQMFELNRITETNFKESLLFPLTFQNSPNHPYCQRFAGQSLRKSY